MVFRLPSKMSKKSILRCISVIMIFSLFTILSIHRFHIQSRLKRNKNSLNDQIDNGNGLREKDTGKFNSIQYKQKINDNYNVDITLCENCTFDGQKYGLTQNLQNSSTITPKRKLWVSMALCFSKNADMYRKKNYPYAQVTPLAILLWNYFFPDIQIILYLIYDQYELKERRILYEEHLNQTNVEIRWVEEGDLDCVTKSQLIRMWAFQEPIINENDIIVTVDVNLFVMSPKILDPIYENPDKKIWVFGWHDTSFIESGIGETFNQNLMSAESKVWRKIIDPDGHKQLDRQWMLDRVEEIGLEHVEFWTSKGLGANSKWYYDQWITTYGVIKNEFCKVPKVSGLWKLPGLVKRNLYFPEMDDSDSCWHGKNYISCDLFRRIIAYGCKWWHFRPFQTLDEHVQKFNEITNNSYNFNFKNMNSELKNMS